MSSVGGGGGDSGRGGGTGGSSSSSSSSHSCIVGLLESLCEHVRYFRNSLTVDALDLSKLTASSKKKV